jgi:hypothetical protein
MYGLIPRLEPPGRSLGYALPGRVPNGGVRNDDGWYEAFDVKPGDKLYLAPEQLVRLWREVAAQTAAGSSTGAGGGR